MIGRFLLCALLTLLALGGALAQTDVVRWTASPSVQTAAPNQDIVVEVRAQIDEGWHLYSTRPIENGPIPTSFKVPTGQKTTVSGPVEQSEAKKKLDPNFNLEVEQYAKEATFRVPVRIDPDAAAGPHTFSLEVTFQTCNDRSCMPPKTLSLPVTVTVAGDRVENQPVAAATGSSDRRDGLLGFFLAALAAGFLALLTPCVFPMVPITVSIFSKQRQGDSLRSAIPRALAFCFGIIVSFTGLGILASLAFGASGVQNIAANPWLNLVLAGIFIAMALNLFGVYEITIPTGLANRFDTSQGGFAGPLLMGLVFSITSFTCTMPFVGGLLVSAAAGDLLYPVVGMLGFSLALAAPFFFLALFPQLVAKLPRSGGWLATTKAFMGFVELAAAVKFVSNADLVWSMGWLTRPVFLALWAGIAAVAGLYLFGALKLPKVNDESRPGPLRLAFGLASIVGAVWFFGAINGTKLGELDAFLPPNDYGMAQKAEDGWLTSYEEATAQSRATGKPILIDFTGVTCTNCRWMEANMFTRPDVMARFSDFILVKLYTDRPTDADRANQELQKKLTGKVTLPIYVVVQIDGKVTAVQEGLERDPGRFIAWMQGGLDPMKTASR